MHVVYMTILGFDIRATERDTRPWSRLFEAGSWCRGQVRRPAPTATLLIDVGRLQLTSKDAGNASAGVFVLLVVFAL